MGDTRLKEPRKSKLPEIRGYRSTLTFLLGSAFFAASYIVTVDRVFIAALFVVILAILMLLDTRLQRRSRRVTTPTIAPEISPKSQTAVEPDRSETKPVNAGAGASSNGARSVQQTPAKTAPTIGPTSGDQPTQPQVGDEAVVGPIHAVSGDDQAGIQPAVAREPTRSQALHQSDWLKVIREHYLQDFIKNGGSGVKFVIPLEAQADFLSSALQRAAQENGYFFAAVDAAKTRVHMVDELFHQIARQVDWDGLARDFMRLTLKIGQYRVPEDPENLGLADIASANGLDMGEMRAIVNNRLRDRLTSYSEITDDFRRAMLRLCQAQLDPKDLSVGGAEAVREWLRGDLKFISGLKSASIFEKVNRSNGRSMISSLSHWLHLCGNSGMVLNLDISRFLVDRRQGQPDGSLYYNTASVLDGYEVLRQFVDGADHLQYCLIVVSAPPGFLTDQNRGVRRYDALYLRIWDEVHHRDAVNPFSALIRISSQVEPRLVKEKQAVNG